MTTAEPLIAVVGLGKKRQGRTVVSGVTLRLMPGEMVGLVGANGGGKTTTLKMLAGLMTPDEGTGRVLGQDIAAENPERRLRLGYMPQRSSLYAELSVRQNLRFRAKVYGDPRPDTTIAAACARWGLDGILDQRIATLSGGWSRRVQLVAAVLHAPPLILLDEPTAGLDVVTRNDLWRWLGELAAAGHGIVIATHDLAEAERCPSILHYQDGQVTGPTSPEALIEMTSASSLETAVAALASDRPA